MLTAGGSKVHAHSSPARVSLRSWEVWLELLHRINGENAHGVYVMRNLKSAKSAAHDTLGLVPRVVMIRGGNKQPQGDRLPFAAGDGRVLGEFFHELVQDAPRDVADDLMEDADAREIRTRLTPGIYATR